MTPRGPTRRDRDPFESEPAPTRRTRIPPGWEAAADGDPRLQAGIDHLQQAAREMIAATRALLDVAEELVDDPRSVGRLMGLFEVVGDLAARPSRRAPGVPGARDDADDDDGQPPVQRIPVS